jgi:uncharacterized protein involved in exopolysaccharide biosynthesis
VIRQKPKPAPTKFIQSTGAFLTTKLQTGALHNEQAQLDAKVEALSKKEAELRVLEDKLTAAEKRLAAG